jgi:hypothetical protein
MAGLQVGGFLVRMYVHIIGLLSSTGCT